MITADKTLYFGPGTVRRVEEGRILVDVDGECRAAALALGYHYEPAPGDRLLLLGNEELYAVGVLSGRGRAVLEIQGDLDLRASGTVRLSGGQGVEVTAPRVALKAGRLEFWARTATQRFVNCYQWIREALQTRAGRSRTIVQGHHLLRADRLVHTARKDVKVDGTRIHLG